MTELQLTFVFAVACAFSRATLNIVDRKLFGINSNAFFLTSFLNNATTFVSALLLALYFSGLQSFRDLLSAAPFVVALMMQIVSYAFSFAFKHKSVKEVNVWTKLSDFFIPLALFLVGSKVDITSLLFAALSAFIVIGVCSEGYFSRKSQKGIPPTAYIVITLIAQALVMEFFGFKGPKEFVPSQYFSFLSAVMFWRLIVSIAPLMVQQGKLKSKDIWSLSKLQPGFIGASFARSTFMLLNQGTFLLSLSMGYAAFAWAILTSTGLLSVVMAQWHLGEQFRKREAAAFVVVIFLALIKVYYF